MLSDEMTQNVVLYQRLYKKSEETFDEEEQEAIIAKMEELYYELDDEEIAVLESLGLC